MTSTPPLASYNRFSVLEVEESENDDFTSPIEVVPKPPQPTPKPLFRRNWERRRLPAHYVLSANSNAPRTSLDLNIELQMTDDGKRIATKALVDSGATGSFIDQDFVRRHGIATRQLLRPMPVLNVDGTSNEAGQITEVVDLIVKYDRHAERMLLAVTGLGRKTLILGYTWLRQHNPEVNWQTQEVKLSRCPRECDECREQVRPRKPAGVVRKEIPVRYGSLSGHQISYAGLYGLLLGSSPTRPTQPDLEDEDPSAESDDEDEPLDPRLGIEEGDRLFATVY